MDDFLNPHRTKRGQFLECKYWSVNKDNARTDKSTLTYETTPSGFFNAEFYDPENKSTLTVGQYFMFNSRNMTIASNDNLEKINKNDLIVIESQPDYIWRVDSVNTDIIRSNYEFSDVTLRYVLSLTR